MEPAQQNQVEAHLCSLCQGKGKTIAKGAGGYFGGQDKCPNCKGAGYIGKDSNYEYYLEKDAQGNLRVIDIKGTLDQTTSQNPDVKTERSSVLRWILFILIIMAYVFYLVVHFVFLKDNDVFKVVTIVFLGSVILLILFGTKLFNKLVNSIKQKIFDDPKDFLWAIGRERSNG